MFPTIPEPTPRQARAIRDRLFASDLRHMIALNDERKRQNAAARERAKANPALCAYLLELAQRRGQPGIDWKAYFLEVDIYHGLRD